MRNRQSDQPFPLLQLPPELWTRICEYVVTSAEPIVLDYQFNDLEMCDAVAQPAVSGVCRIIRCEALALFYNRNTFIVKDNTTVAPILAKWLCAIAERHGQCLEDLLIISDYTDVASYYGRLLRGCGFVIHALQSEVREDGYPYTYKVSFVG